MAHQPVPFPSPREQQELETSSHLPTGSFQLAEPASAYLSLAEEMAVLREQIRTNGLDLDAFLNQILKHARALTGSSGAAVALRQGKVILCRARCGETSPPLGAQLDADFGISGECLRTGKALRCDDSETDPRLDPEICRQLGLRSIAVVPIFESATVAGILEVFAGQPHAFDDRHLEILQQLAELVTAASARVTQENQPTIYEAVAGPRSEQRPRTPAAGVHSHASPSPRERLRKWTAPIALRRYYASALAVFTSTGSPTNKLRNWTTPIASRRYYAAAIVIFALAGVLTILGWKPWRRTERTVVPSTETSRQPTTASASPATNEARRPLNIAEPPAVGRNVTSKPAAFPTRSDHSSHAGAEKAALVEPISGKDETRNGIVPPSPSNQTRDRVGPANAPEPLAPISLIGATDGFGKDAVVVNSALLPQVNLPLMASQGVSGGALERKVQPIYPPEARSARLQGTVVLQVVIDEVGEVQNPKTVSGDTVLARAAIDAVRQWRYQPYLLNGQPVKVPLEITVKFTLP